MYKMEWCPVCLKPKMCWLYPLTMGPMGPKEPQYHPVVVHESHCIGRTEPTHVKCTCNPGVTE